MKENRISFIIIIGILAFVGLLALAFENPFNHLNLEQKTYTIIKKWNMPNELDEISGISWISKNKIACVQDEQGIIFIYNLEKKIIEQKVNFGKSGDYEALAIIDSTAYIIKSDGKIFEVLKYLSPNFKTKEYQTPFSEKNNIESLVADTLNNRLLFTVKDKDPNSETYKGVYAFNLETKKTEAQPIFKIPLTDSIFGQSNNKVGKENIFYPSEIGINPKNSNIYVLDGKKHKLLILSSLGRIIKLHNLTKKEFPQAEGITFSDEGTIFISNEGKKGTATILQVAFNE
jgi:uncharacterized protein YjiK